MLIVWNCSTRRIQIIEIGFKAETKNHIEEDRQYKFI
jgi:hypothetical protein